MDFKSRSIVDFLSAIIGSATTLLFALNGLGVWSLVWGALSIDLCRVIVLNIFCPYLKPPDFTLRGIKQFITFGGYVTISRVLWFFYSQSDIFIIGRLMGKKLLGVYSVALTLASLPMEKLSGIINQVAFPAFSHVQSDLHATGSHFLKSVRMMSIFAFPLLWGISSIANDLVHILLGTKWSSATVPLQILSLVIPIRMISNLMSPTLLGIGRSDINFFNVVTASIVILPGILIGSFWGINGVCFAWLLCFPVVFLFNISRVTKVLKIKKSDVLSEIVRPATAAFIMYISVLGVKSFLKTLDSSVGGLLLVISIAAVTYTGLIFYVNRNACREVLSLIGANMK